MENFIGEIRPFAFNFAPMGWAACNGQILQIQQNTALFSLLGTAYGGDGKTTFGLPNLQGRAPLDAGAGPGLTYRELGAVAGAATVPLSANNFPPHSHGLNVVTTSNATLTAVADHYLSNGGNLVGKTFSPTNSYQSQPSANTQLAVDAVQTAGTATGPIAHDNMQPYLPVLICIALTGYYPSRG